MFAPVFCMVDRCFYLTNSLAMPLRQIFDKRHILATHILPLKRCFNGTGHFKRCKNCLNTNIYSYLDTSRGQCFSFFSTPLLIRHLWQLKTVGFLCWCLMHAVLLLLKKNLYFYHNCQPFMNWDTLRYYKSMKVTYKPRSVLILDVSRTLRS